MSNEGSATQDKNLLLQMDPDDEFASYALGFRSKVNADNANMHPEISMRYSNDQFLLIYKNLGRFEHPLNRI